MAYSMVLFMIAAVHAAEVMLYLAVKIFKEAK